ncbi:type VII toxin-antitoxin system MntA family adenylyltransferase antitoxin [Clostridium senegalense]|uniref:Nucleotidyltransferase domain-containing protein n=1 Tax=Clostridium senegalense TaxID=1465809 RepID=A0A6M0H2E3_9CLOT|nr:nucleotidyltransferase domain-containing protein [Clostridium senegalense]NEU04334.1 nucleotidyltransferase domain-containing protein [Clostridium senegalense]
MSLNDLDHLYNAKEIINILRSQKILDLFKSYKINSVIVFGSIVRKDFAEYSDVDIAILSKEKISLNSIMELEEKLKFFLKREIDIINLNNDDLDLKFKVSVYDTGILIYNDDLDLYSMDYNKTDIVYKDNEEFRYFRERDVILDE